MGRRIGHYEILRVIGRGGMATVYLARQTDLERDVALKELALAGDADTEAARRFLREARLAGSLGHPNIVMVHEYLQRKGTPFIAMEYLARGSLRPYVGRLSLAQAGGVLQGVLAGLAHAHGRSVIHRDIKPENVMVTDSGGVKIADFGIAKAVDATRTSTTLTTAGTTLGTPRYMSPERAMGQALGPWSDLYSVGALAFELLSGQAPFQDTAEPMAILMRQINEPIPPVSSVAPDAGDALDGWIGELLEKDPRERTESAAAAADALDDILIGRLGPRWLREAKLPARAAATVREPRRAPLPPLPTSRSRALPPPPPIPASPSRALTVAPATVALPRRRRRRGALALPLAAVALAGVAFAGHGLRAAPADSADAPLPADVSPREAATPASRARGAQRLAAGYARAARRARSADPEGATRLEETAQAYRDAADAAVRGDGSDYDDAIARAAESRAPVSSSGVGDSRSDDPSDDEPDEDDNGD